MSTINNRQSLNGNQVREIFSRTRKTTIDLCDPLERDDYMVQSTPDTSPPKWHLGHTTWFFDNFILSPFRKGYEPVDPGYAFVFNSYYNTVGKYMPKPSRSVISRPSLEKVLEYREKIDRMMVELMEDEDHPDRNEILERAILGINHEQQHQELLLMDILRNFYSSPSRPVYRERPAGKGRSGPVKWLEFPEGVDSIGHGGTGFAFDNETPVHRELIHGFSIAHRPATNGEYIAFIEDGGYEKPELWLSAGWDWRVRKHVELPLYWERNHGEFSHFTLSGMKEVDPEEPVMHVSYYEADAFARWSGTNLPTEFQWEHAMRSSGPGQPENYLEKGTFAPLPHISGQSGFSGVGNAWEWTSSAYLPYPGFRALPGSLGEYNGKFMSGQMVLRGASHSTPQDHYRVTYRNFYHLHSRWQFSGIRLSRDGFNE